MADELYLSCWPRGFTEANMLRHWEKVLSRFPFSRLGQRPSTLRIHAVDFTQPVLMEDVFAAPLDPNLVMDRAREYKGGDCLYRLESWWDLLQTSDGKDWTLQPAPVALCCFGPGFENEEGDPIRLELGQDVLFLPDPEQGPPPRVARANVQSLMRLVHDLDDSLPMVKRQLWLDSGANFAARLEELLAAHE